MPLFVTRVGAQGREEGRWGTQGAQGTDPGAFCTWLEQIYQSAHGSDNTCSAMLCITMHLLVKKYAGWC